MKKNWIRNSILIFLTIVFLYFFLKSVDWKEVSYHISQINLALFLLLIIAVPIQYIFRVIRWKYLLVHEKENVTFYNQFAAISVGFMVSQLIPGRVGEVVRPLYLAQKEGMKKGFVLGTVVVERIFDIFAMCLLLGLFLLVRPRGFADIEGAKRLYSNLTYWGVGGFVFAALILFVSLCLFFLKDKTLALSAGILKILPKRISEKILRIMDDFIQGLKFFHSWRNFILYFSWSLLIWLWMIFYYWLFLLAFNISVPYFLLIPYVFILMVGAAIPTPGMVGGYDAFSKWGLTTFFKIEPNLAVGMTIVIHAVQVMAITLMGFIILWRDGLSFKKIRNMD